MSWQFDPNVTVSSDKASMVNGNNGENTLSVVRPSGSGRTKDGACPPNLKLSRLQDFSLTEQNFCKCPSVPLACLGVLWVPMTKPSPTPMFWYIDDYISLVTVVKKERWNMCHRLSSAMDLLRVERLLARNQGIWEAEYTKFVNELSVFVNKELSKF